MKPRTPSLIELQHAMRQSLLGHAGDDAINAVLADGLDPRARLDIYGNTAASVLVNALQLAFPAVQQIVGAEFFEGAARLFSSAMPPRSAWLDDYGAAFPDFLAQMPQSASVPYLADVARLEWQINCVLHAPDDLRLDVACLAQFDEDALAALRLRPHPAVRLLQCDYPADVIWRAVLERDDRAMRAIRLDGGPVHLLVQRVAEGVDVHRLRIGDWRISAALFAGEPVGAALALTADTDTAGYALLAAHLARGCFAQAQHTARGLTSNGDSLS